MRTCDCGCGKSLEGKRPHARWWSDACRERAKRARNGAETGRKGRKRKSVRYEVDPVSGCWVWKLARFANGYACVWDPTRPSGARKGRMIQAHIVYWEQANGRVPAGMELHHLCERTDCVNPEHLEALPRAAHAAQHDRRGRQHRVLDRAHVMAMRRNALTPAEVVEATGCNYMTAWQAKTGRSWKHLPSS